MIQENLKKSAISGLAYRLAERITSQLISLIINIILARIISPEEHGTIAIVLTIITILTTLVDCGFGTALIQKKDSDQIDFSSVFWASIVFAAITYIVIFSFSPLIASAFDEPVLKQILRVIGATVFLTSIKSVQNAYVSKNLKFKYFFLSTVVGTIVSGTISVSMAYSGYGIWALVTQYIVSTMTSAITLFIITKWHPSFIFQYDRFKKLFSFSWKILVAGLLTSIYDETRAFIIAGKYSSSDLAYYTKAQQFTMLISNNVCTTITNVMYPIYARCTSEKGGLKNAVRRSLKLATYLLCPLLLGFAATSKSVILFLLGNQWLPCIPYISIFCIFYLFKPIKVINQASIIALGKSNAYMYLNVFEKTLGIFLILVTMNKGPKLLALGAAVTYGITALSELIVNGIFLNYRFREALFDIGPNILLSTLMYVFVYLIGKHLECSAIGVLLIQFFSGFLFYLIASFLIKNEAFFYILNNVRAFVSKKRT